MTLSADRNAPRAAERAAERAEPCWYCKSFIQIGDPIFLIAYGRYGCKTCGHDPEVKRRFYPPATRNAPGYAVVCPTCGADSGELCRTTSGKKRSLHPDRKALAC